MIIKTIKTLIVVTGLLCSAQAMACDIYIHFRNSTDVTLSSVGFAGVFGRYSDTYPVESGKSLHPVYNATGSVFTCHGDYWLASSSNKMSNDTGTYCDFGETMPIIHMGIDGNIFFEMTGKDENNKCIVTAFTTTLKVNSLDESLDCVAKYSQNNHCDYDHWSQLYEVCQTYSYPAMEKDNFLLNQIRDGNCSYDNWSNLYDQITARE